MKKHLLQLSFVSLLIIPFGFQKTMAQEKRIEVIIHGDKDMKWVETGEDDENVDVSMIKTEDGEEVKVVKKKIRVEINEDDDEGEKVEKPGKKKKK